VAATAPLRRIALKRSFMSEFHDDMAQLVEDRASNFTTPVKDLTSGRTFLAEIEEVDPLIVTTELGEDYRDVVTINVDSAEAIALMQTLPFVEFRLFGVLTKNKVLKQRNNPASPQAKYWAQNWTGKDS
jgi:hypothetical protein